MERQSHSVDAGQESPTAPVVSIVITTYNQAHFLREAIESALGQTTAESVEVVVVDDGSADDPAAVVAGFPDVRLFRQANERVGAARNAGWRAARGRYVVFLDADDRLLPDAAAINLRQFASKPECAFVYGAHRFIDGEGRPRGTPRMHNIGDDAYKSLLIRNCVGMHATVMYRRDLLEDAGGFDTHLAVCEDFNLYLRLTLQHPVVSSPELVAEYRKHGSNISSNLPLMLRTDLQLLRNQKQHIGTDARRRAAYAAGRRRRKKNYASRQLSQLHHAFSGKQSSLQALVDTAKIFALAPIAFIGTAFRAIAHQLYERLGLPRRDWFVFGSLRRLEPISPSFGFDRGMPVDRRYIEDFLARHANDVRGRVLEVGDNDFTMRFGGERVTQSDVLHVDEKNPKATFVGDLADGDFLPSDTFDCIVLTQTLHLIFDMPKAVATLHRILKPGGVLLLTVPGVSSVDRGEWGESWYWSLTPNALRLLAEEQFAAEDVAVIGYGNVLTAIAFLHGLAERELHPHEFDVYDPHYPVIVAARAIKAGSPDGAEVVPG